MKGQSYTRYTTKLSLDLKPTKWFNLGLNVNGTFSEQQYGSSASSVGQLIKGMPSNLYAASTSFCSLMLHLMMRMATVLNIPVVMIK